MPAIQNARASWPARHNDLSATVPAAASVEWADAQIEDLFVVVVVKWLAGFSSPAARMAVWPA
jgi:hypothetical protein